MAECRDYVALDWVSGEIENTLKQACQALEEYADNPKDGGHLRSCLALAHQVQATLRMVEFHGAALLASEIEALARALIDDVPADMDEAMEALMAGFLQLPAYLERVRGVRRDMPGSLLATINELRAVRGDSLMSESALFSPEMTAAKPFKAPSSDLRPEEFQQTVKKLRQVFQLAFVGIIRNKQLDQNLESLVKVSQRLFDLSNGRAREPLWRIAMAVVEGLANGSVEANAAVKSLLKEIDSELKNLLHSGPAFLDQPPSKELLKTFLYYIAHAKSGSPLIDDIQRDYQLEEAVAGGRDEPGASPDSIRSVVKALVEEFTCIKELLDLHMRGQDRDLGHLRETQVLLKRVGDTLAVLGFSEPLLSLRSLASRLDALVSGEMDIDEPVLQELAAGIIDIEQSLLKNTSPVGSRDESASPHLLEARDTVALEARKGLEEVKALIIEFVASQWDHHRLETIPELIGGIRGGLAMVGFRLPARIMGASERYLSEALIAHEAIPDWQSLDALADVLSGVDYFLERYLEDRDGSHELILNAAVQSLAVLGYSVDTLDTIQLDDGGTSAGTRESVERHGNLAGIVGEVPVGTAANDAELEQTGLPVQSTAEQEEVGSLKAQASSTVESAPLRQSETVSEVIEQAEDPDIAEIFVEEAGEVLEAINELMPGWRKSPADDAILGEMRRAWHTLKGSGRMVGACILGELAWSIENLLNKVIESSAEPGAAQIDFVDQVAAMVPPLVLAFEQQRAVNKTYVEEIIAMAKSLTGTDQTAEVAPGVLDPALLDPAVARSSLPELACSVTATGSEAMEPENAADVSTKPVQADAPVTETSESSLDAEVLAIFETEAETHLATIQEFIEQACESDLAPVVTDGLQRALHTLKGSANMAGVKVIARIVTPLEKFIKALQATGAKADHDVIELLRDTARLAFIGLQRVREQGDCGQFSEADELVLRIEKISSTAVPAASGGDDVSLLNRIGDFMLAASDELAAIETVLARWKSEACAAETDWRQLREGVKSIAVGAEALTLESPAILARRWLAGMEGLENPDVRTITVFELAAASLEQMLDCLAADQAMGRPDEPLLDALDDLGASKAAGDELIGASSASLDHVPLPPDAVMSEGEDIDPEIVGLFIEEARDLLENIDETVHRWRRDSGDRSCLELLQRLLHTLKGGARLAGLRQFGDLSHEFETFLIEAEEQNREPDQGYFGEFQRYQDQLNAQMDVLGDVVAPEEAAQNPEEAIEAAVDQEAGIQDSTRFISLPARSLHQDSAKLNEESAASRPQQESVKVAAQLIEDLVNLAGETSINRGRVEEQVNEVLFSLTEMDSTVDRMQEQLRRLDRETEAQLIFRQEQVESMGLEEFDPLEMDRYSVLQQLSRSLMESSSDILEVKRSIFNKARDVETLLLQQSRINTDLQEGLMRSRMVPFSRMVPRLRRIVRQVSVELNKEVNLVLNNTEGEMDRTILERMLPPFEHMLRNAVDHGIEDHADRAATGKPGEGSITIGFQREAGDVVISLSDDGRGVDLAAVRAKAVERGMLKEGAALSDNEILQFILQPGFSTAQAVTQISGRGVGMDVVASEIKQLGGSVEIQSEYGRGTRFSIRLPFTVSVNRALMVGICGDSYALPLNTIEGIVRVSPFELESYYEPDSPRFEYAGQSYQLRYLGALIGKKRTPDLHSETMPLPVILVRSGEQSVAVQVDNLLGSREIVVKALGPQFNAVQGLSGATVLGDGGVVVILDLHSMIRADVSQYLMQDEDQSLASLQAQAQPNRNLLVMVVDDSVTVRKVTSRFLERNGMDVLLAKDGVDAIHLLQDHTPDVMLLDIEMPRMDGFEVAGRIKNGSKLKNLPIIMITSRTGEKHRERAESLGVDRYMGKPYQELELMKHIEELTGYVA